MPQETTSPDKPQTFTHMTEETSNPINSIIKCADDTSAAGLFSDGDEVEQLLLVGHGERPQNPCSSVRIVFCFLGVSTKDLTWSHYQEAETLRNNHLYQKLLVPFYWCWTETSCLLPSLRYCTFSTVSGKHSWSWDPAHPGHFPSKLLPSSRCYRALKARTKRPKQGFQARAIHFFFLKRLYTENVFIICLVKVKNILCLCIFEKNEMLMEEIGPSNSLYMGIDKKDFSILIHLEYFDSPHPAEIN